MKKILSKLKEDKNSLVWAIFVLAVILGIVQFFFYLFSTNPPYLTNFPLFHQNPTDTFADFFNINTFIFGLSPYIEPFYSSYPPFNFIIALPFMLVQRAGLKILSICLYFASVVAMIVVLSVLFYKKHLNGQSKKTLIFIILLCFFSTPMLFLLERANYLFVTFFFTGLFLLLKDSEKRWQRILALCSLAFATAMKMYPAMFALLLLKDKRYKDLLFTALLSVQLFFLPFFILSGGFVKNITLFFSNLNDFILSKRLSVDVSTGNLIRIIAHVFGGDSNSQTVFTIGLVVRAVLFITSIVCVMLSKQTWQTLILISLMGVIVPMPAMKYNLVFTLFGFVLWLLKSEKGKMDVLYLVLFFIIIAPLSYGFIIAPVPPSEIYPGIALEVDNYLGLSVQTFLQGLSVVILTVTITVHTLISKIKGIKKA